MGQLANNLLVRNIDYDIAAYILTANEAMYIGNTIDPKIDEKNMFNLGLGFNAIAFTQNPLIRPAIGMKIHFRPINQSQFPGLLGGNRIYNQLAVGRERWGNVCFDVGIHIGSIKNSNMFRDDLFATNTVYTGIGFRLLPSFYLNVGNTWFYKTNRPGNDNVNASYINSRITIGLSYGWDVIKVFSAFGKALGISF